MPFAHLLLAAFQVTFDRFHPHRIVEIGHRRLVEGNVPVAADPQQTTLPVPAWTAQL